MALPIRTRPSSASVSLSLQEASISLLSLSIRGQTECNHNHRKLTKPITWTTALSNSWNYEPYHVGPPKMDGLRWRVLTKCGPLEKGMTNHFNILALRMPWTLWKGKKIGYWKMNSSGRSVQFSSVAKSCPTLCDPMNHSTQGLPVHHQLREFTQTHVHWVSDAIQPSHPLSSPSPPAPIPPSIRVFSKESTLCMRWPKYWSFSFSIIPSKEHPGLISFRMDWLDLLAVQGTLRVFSNTTVQKHQFFGAQLSSQSNSHIHTWPQEKP